MPPGTFETPEGVSPYFYPPRAAQSPRWKRLQRRLDRAFESLQHRLPSVRDPELVAGASLIPGLGHLLLERRLGKAAGFFCAYWLLLAWTALFSSLDLWLCSLGIFSFHQWIMTDGYRTARARLGLPPLRGRRIIVFSLVTGAALGLCYRQAGQIAAAYGTVLKMKTDRFAPLLEEGDRLVIARHARYSRGDIVYSAKHEGLERIVGLPGDEISIGDDGLLLNGSPLPKDRAPLAAPLIVPMRGALRKVPPGAYCVFFTAQNHYMKGNSLLDFFMIPEKDIDGRLALRYYPEFRRFNENQ